MESNREGAEQCYAKAVDAVKGGDRDKAIRMLQKSIRMFETEKATTLLEQIEKMQDMPKSSPNENENVRRRAAPQPEKSESRGDFTPEQKNIVTRILQAKNDYYKILALEKGANENEIKKAYRKLALKLHPDKNQAPRADEAFKMVGKAYAVLSDQDKRDSYDRYGADGPQVQSNFSRGGTRHYHQGGYYDDDFNPEDIFNMFFGGGMPTGNVRRHHFRFNAGHQHQRRHQQQYESNNFGVWLQFMPLLVLIGLSLISNLMTPDPTYSLHRYPNRGYSTKIFTEKDRIPYYVKSDYATEYPQGSNDRRKVESQVRNEHIENLRINCYQETLNAEQKMRRAQLYRDKKMMEQAQNMPRPNCNRLNELTGG